MKSTFPVGDSWVYKLTLYVDAILCLPSDLFTSIPAVLDINKFSKLSCYRFNWNKSEVLPLMALFPKCISSRIISITL